MSLPPGFSWDASLEQSQAVQLEAFGKAASYVAPGGGAATSFTAIEPTTFGEAASPGSVADLLCAGELPAFERNGQVTFRSNVYRVAEVIRDRTGWVRLKLRAA